MWRGMVKIKYLKLWWGIMVCGLSLGLFVACGANVPTPPAKSLRTWLLVKAPATPLPLNKPVTVKSRTEDAMGVSHVELYAVQLPDGESGLLLNSEAAAGHPPSFTSSLTFIPTMKGHYMIKVVGYNKQGQSAESEYIDFDVE